jgi:hypothetical protein
MVYKFRRGGKAAVDASKPPTKAIATINMEKAKSIPATVSRFTSAVKLL